MASSNRKCNLRPRELKKIKEVTNLWRVKMKPLKKSKSQPSKLKKLENWISKRKQKRKVKL